MKTKSPLDLGILSVEIFMNRSTEYFEYVYKDGKLCYIPIGTNSKAIQKFTDIPQSRKMLKFLKSDQFDQFVKSIYGVEPN